MTTPGIDYAAIRKAIADQLRADPDMAHCTVAEEPEIMFAEQSPFVPVYFESRAAKEDIQRIAASTRLDLLLQFSVWASTFSMNRLVAITDRDATLRLIEVALMRQPMLNLPDYVARLWLEGGRLMDGREPNGFSGLGEVKVRVHARGIITPAT